MKEPERLIHYGATDTERRLLMAGAAEEPSSATAHRVAVAVGISAAVGITTNTIATAATLPKLWLTKLQWLGVTLGAGGLAWVGYTTLQPEAPGPSPRTTLTASVPARSPSVVTAPRATRLALEQPSALPARPSLKKTPAATRPTPTAGSGKSTVEPVGASEPRSASIAAEVAAVDSARRAIGRGEASQALRELNAYQAEYPHGVLGQEAALLRIEALAQAGNIGAAKALARRLFASQPSSPHRKRIESIVGPLGPTAPGAR